MSTILFLLPPDMVFTSSQKILLRNGFRIVSMSESRKHIFATKKNSWIGPGLKIELTVSETDGQTSLTIDRRQNEGVLAILSEEKNLLTVQKLFDELNTHVR